MERALLEQFLEEGLSLEQIGKRVGRHPSTVGYWLVKHGLRAVHGAKYAPKGGIARATLEPLTREGLTLREIAARLEVSIATIRYWLEKHGLQTDRVRWRLDPTTKPKSLERRCRRHGTVVFSRTRRGHYVCRRCAVEKVARRRRRVKQILVTEGGGRCLLCGYDRYAGALQFHHVDPARKAFTLSRAGITRALEKARAEARKCILLCANCHAEVEAGIVAPAKVVEASPR